MLFNLPVISTLALGLIGSVTAIPFNGDVVLTRAEEVNSTSQVALTDFLYRFYGKHGCDHGDTSQRTLFGANYGDCINAENTGYDFSSVEFDRQISGISFCDTHCRGGNLPQGPTTCLSPPQGCAIGSVKITRL